jgi:type II secretion system protein G
MKKQKTKGFTLIELLVVIAIIGLLASIVLVSLNNARQKARDSKRLSDIRQVALALELYADSNNAFYPTVVGCTAGNWSGTMTTCLEGTGAAPCNVSYMTKVPTDPKGGTYFYYYASPTPSTEYLLMATLEVGTNPALNTDVDAATLGCTCTDPAYCVMP